MYVCISQHLPYSKIVVYRSILLFESGFHFSLYVAIPLIFQSDSYLEGFSTG